MVNCAAVHCHNNKSKNKNKTFFSLPKDTAVALVWIAKPTREKDNLPSKVFVCSNHFQDDCFDSSWMLQSILTQSNRTIQKRLRA